MAASMLARIPRTKEILRTIRWSPCRDLPPSYVAIVDLASVSSNERAARASSAQVGLSVALDVCGRLAGHCASDSEFSKTTPCKVNPPYGECVV